MMVSVPVLKILAHLGIVDMPDPIVADVFFYGGLAIFAGALTYSTINMMRRMRRIAKWRKRLQ